MEYDEYQDTKDYSFLLTAIQLHNHNHALIIISYFYLAYFILSMRISITNSNRLFFLSSEIRHLIVLWLIMVLNPILY